MNEMMKECCGKDGVPDFDKMKAFMEKCGKMQFSDAEMKMMREFCAHAGKPDADEMKQFMRKCGC